MKTKASWGRWKPDASKLVWNITPELQSEITVAFDGSLPLYRAHMVVC